MASKYNPFNLIDFFAPNPVDPIAEKNGFGKVTISSIEELNRLSIYKTKTRRMTYAIILVFVYNILGFMFYLDNKDLAEPALYELSPEVITKQNTSAYNEKRLMFFEKPRHTEAAIQRWVDTTLNDLYNFDFLNFEERITHIEQYFTKTGFENFVYGLQNAGAYERITGEKLTINTIVFDKALFPTTFGGKKISDGNLYYHILVPMRMTVQKGNNIQEYSTNFKIMLVLLVDNDGKTGFFINSFDMDEPIKVL